MKKINLKRPDNEPSPEKVLKNEIKILKLELEKGKLEQEIKGLKP